MTRRALLSVYDKTGLEELARGLAELGFELVSSGGTARAIEAAGLPVVTVEEVTGVPEMLDHRVVTLHPKIHGGILADRSRESHRSDLETHGIEPFDLVVVNLYPFVEQPGIETIDIGGPALIRAAAKNSRTRRRRDERFAVRRRARRAARARHACRRDEAPPGDSRLRAYRRLRRGDSPLAAGWRAAP